MKNIFLLIINAISFNSYCQTTFDVFNYTEPAGWKKETNSTMVSYTISDEKKGSFCVIYLYANTTGKETQRDNFDYEWQKLVVSTLSVTEKPEVTKGANISGWETMTGVAEFEFNKVKAAAMLTTFTLSGKTASLLCVFNDQEYVGNFSSFITNLSLGKPVTTENQHKPESGTGVLGDYVFTSPPGFTKEVKANEIVLRDARVPITISILPMQPSSGNLETDLKTIFFSVFKGFSNPANGGPQDYSTFKGTTASGYNYILEFRDIQQTNNVQNRVSATMILVQVNNMVAVFAGSYEQKSAVWSNVIDQINDQYIYLLQSISFKNFKPKPVPVSIVGKWSSRSSTTTSNYEFHADGTYSWIGTFSVKSGYSTTHDKITTTSKEHTGKWSLNGNELTTYISKTKKTNKGYVRIFYENIGDTWVKKLGWLSFYEDGRFGEVSFFPNDR